MNLMKKNLIFYIPIAILGVLLIILGLFLGYKYIRTSQINSFEECVAQGYPILEIYPEQCTTPDGRNFTKEIKSNPILPVESDDVLIYHPTAGQVITSPLTVDGSAPGSWFWEGVITTELHNSKGGVIASTAGIVKAGEDWMTEYPVNFEAVLEFDVSSVEGEGYLVIKKSNPSGLPEYDEEYTMSVTFNNSQAVGKCVITGCSSQICSSKEIVTDCMYKEEYACYKNATCELQANGACGWTMTDELKQCLGSN